MSSHQHDESCRKMFALLSEYLDLELPAEACRKMETHIGGCEPCAEFTGAYAKPLSFAAPMTRTKCQVR